MYIRKRQIYEALLWFYFIGETLMIIVAGGNFKTYFAISLICWFLCVSSRRVLNCLFSSKVFVLQMLWCLVFWLSAVISDNPKGAFLNTISFTLYLMTSFFAIYVLFFCKLTVEEFQDALRKLFFFLVLYGIVQLVLYKTVGLRLGLNDFANTQLAGWQIPGFSKEANGHGKTVGFAIAYCLPMFIDDEDNESKKRYKPLLIISLITMVISLTRSAAYADIIVLAIAVIIGINQKKKLSKIIGVIAFIALLLGAVLFLIDNDIIELDSVSMMKIERFFSLSEEELREDSSGGFRMQAFDGTLAMWTHSLRTVLIGWGPGQAYYEMRGFTVRVSGLDTLGMLASIGILGVATFFIMSILVVTTLMKLIRADYYKTFCYQLLYGYIFCFAVNFIACILYYPYLWLVVGATVYLDVSYRN